MKRKSLITIFAIAFALSLALSVFTGCKKNKHKFSDEWKYNETSHWHECLTKKHTDTTDKIAHDFNAGEVIVQPTEDSEGVKRFTCNTCGYQKDETVAKLAHTHTFNNGVWENDEASHWHPATCAHKGEKSSLEEHIWDEGKVTTEPTETTEGVKTYTCSKCGRTKTAPIGKLDHVHTFDTTRWDSDAENHWRPATCSHTDEKESIEKHIWNEGVVTTEPTETTEGVKTYTCTKCGRTKTATIGQLDHVHTFDTTRWEYDTANHWHPATCPHTDEKNATAPHEWNDGEITTPANYGVEGVKTFTCAVCSATRTEPIAALEAKNNAISFASDLSLDKVYDGTAVVVDAAKVNRKGDGAITIEYRHEDESAYSTVAPKDAGTYYVRASVAPTAEWLGGKIEKEFTIEQRSLSLSKNVYECKIDQTLESGKFGLECINVAEETNNVVEWVTIGVPDQYRAVGIYNILAYNLIVDNQNFVIESSAIVRFTIWDVPDSFYAGIQDLFTLSGTGEVVITTKIANGSIKTGDQILVNEIGKIITVKKIQKGIGTSATVVDTAIAGDEVGMIIEGATRSELERGYMLSEPDTIIGYSKVTVTIRAYTKDEGGQNTPIQTRIKPQVVFADTFGEVTGEVTFPEGADLLLPGEMLENVTVNFQGKKIPAFVGRRFKLRSGGKTIAECIITAVPQATSVNCAVSEPTGKTAVIEPIESGEKTFALNLNRSSAFENLVDSEAIDLVVKYNGVTIGSYKRTGLGVGEGDLAHVENGGALQGSYININLAKGVSGLTDADGNWICDQENVTFDVSVTLTQQLDNLGEGSVETVSLGKDEVKYFTLNELENLTSGWYSFVDAIENSGRSRYRVYTDAGEKVDMMSDMFKSNGGKYYVKYSSPMVLASASVGFKAAKAELTATNTTSSLIIPSGKKDDRLVIKVTLNKALSYFSKNTVKFKANVSAFNGSVVKVFNSDYQFYNEMGYQSFSDGHLFYLPTKNTEQTYAYIMMKYAADLAGTAELKFQHTTAGIQMLNSDFQQIPFRANASMNFIFKASEVGQYKIEIAAVGSATLIPPTTIKVDKVYDTDFAAATIIGNTNFNANATGYYSLTLKNMTDSEQKVRIHVVKVS